MSGYQCLYCRQHDPAPRSEPRRSRNTADTFWRRVDASTGPASCWLWTGATRRGYGAVRWQGSNSRAHRIAWFLTNGPIPDGLHVLHACDNPLCCNPAHLFLGTHADNMADRVEKGRTVLSAQPGVLNPQARLSVEDVVAIRDSSETGAALAARFGVSKSHVNSIRRGDRWTDPASRTRLDDSASRGTGARDRVESEASHRLTAGSPGLPLGSKAAGAVMPGPSPRSVARALRSEG